jgi:hypothetical protein
MPWVVDHWILGGITLVGGVIGLVALARNPAAQRSALNRPAAWWPFDLPSWRALVRIAPLGAAEGVIWGAWFILQGMSDSTAVDAAETALQVLIVIALGLMVTVALFNRPRIAVGPQLRELPGALEEWRAEG